MANPFHFKHFSIYQEKGAMKVGTDSVLLGAWTNVTNVGRILDIGTGNGILSLMMAQRSGAIIDAIEIDKEAFQQALVNIGQSRWKERIHLHCISLQQFEVFDHTYDLIISNPPFFLKSLLTKDVSRSIARHAHHLSFDELLGFTVNHLSENGRLSVILPVPEADIFSRKCEALGMFASRKLWIKPTPSKPAKRVLMEWQKMAVQSQEDQLVIEENGRHGYSRKYISLTRDFYLKF